MEHGKVSIVLPVYNGQEHLREAIESVLSQTYRNLEFIIVNDCSTDRTYEIAKEYADADERVKVVNNVTNLKLPRTINAGFHQATGDYLSWTSDDNLFEPDAIARMVEYLKEHEDVDMVYADCCAINEASEVTCPTMAEPIERISYTNPVGACFLYRRAIAEKVGGYDPDAFLAEDYDYWVRIYRSGTIHYLNEVLYRYRRHSASLSATRKAEINRQTYRVIEKNFIYLYNDACVYGYKYRFFESIMQRWDNQPPRGVKRMMKRLAPFYGVYCWKNNLTESFLRIRGKIRSKRKKQ